MSGPDASLCVGGACRRRRARWAAEQEPRRERRQEQWCGRAEQEQLGSAEKQEQKSGAANANGKNIALFF
jgi:hypothetical protein